MFPHTPFHVRENEGPKLEEDDSSDLMTLGVPNFLYNKK